MSEQEHRDNVRWRHSAFQMDCFIIGGDGYTAYGCYHQATRELDKRCRGLEELYENQRQIEFALRWKFWKNKTRLRQGLEKVTREIAELEREKAHFLKRCDMLLKALGPLGDEMRAALEEDYWETKFKVLLARDLICLGRPERHTLELICACPPPMRKEIVQGVIGLAQGDLMRIVMSAEMPMLGGPDA